MTSSDNEANVVPRTTLLSWVIAGLGGLIAAALGAVGLGYFVSPLFQKRDEDWVDVGRSRDFAPGRPLLVEFTQRIRDAWVTTEKRASAWVVTSNGKDFIAFDPRCTHLGCPYRWDVKSTSFVCPCHTAAFAIDGGVLGGPPPRPLDRYPSKVAEGRLIIQPEAPGES